MKKFLLLPVVALIASLALAFGNGTTSTRTAESATINPVVLVHGWYSSSSAMATLKTRFEAQGRQAFSINLPSQNNITNAQALATFITSVKSQTGAAKVDLVSHSMGALSTRYYIKRLGGGANVSEYVSLGGPQYGVPLACFLFTSAGGQMCPFSSFLNDLNAGDDTPGTLLYTTIYSTGDEVVPNWSSRLDGGACYKQVTGLNHSALHEDATVFNYVLSAVDGACPGVIQ